MWQFLALIFFKKLLYFILAWSTWSWNVPYISSLHLLNLACVIWILVKKFCCLSELLDLHVELIISTQYIPHLLSIMSRIRTVFHVLAKPNLAPPCGPDETEMAYDQKELLEKLWGSLAGGKFFVPSYISENSIQSFPCCCIPTLFIVSSIYDPPLNRKSFSLASITALGNFGICHYLTSTIPHFSKI